MKKGRNKIITAVLCAALLLSCFIQENLLRVYAEEGIAENALYVAPGATGSGTKENPMDLEKALTAVKAGQTIYLLEGTYSFDHTVKIAEGNDGEDGKYKTLRAYPGAEVILDFSTQPFGKAGVVLEAAYWHVYGITICNAGDNGMLLSGDYNIIELCVFDGNKDTGLQLSRSNGSYNSVEQWPSYNYILNCTSRNNSDPGGENADGFAPKLTCGNGNVFDGCLAYNNVDDGWDCYAKTATGPIGVVTLINCIAFRNGQTEDGVFTPDSDGNGFKLGGGGLGTPHVVINCLAFENKNCGFTDNNNPEALTLINCTAFNNNLSEKKADFNVYRCKNANAVNLIAYNGVKNTNKFQNMSANYILYASKNDWYAVTSYGPFDTGNSAIKGTKTSNGLTATDFVETESPALGTDFHVIWREADGSVNTHGYAMLSEDSAYASFATDGKAGGARFGSGTEFVTPENVEIIKTAALAGTTPSLAATATPKPTTTATPKPTATATPKPTATATPKPTATATPKPTATVTPKPTATATPEPTATVTPKPAATATPEPTATATPKPTATATPEPTATVTPKPTATATPAPTATVTPEATEQETEGNEGSSVLVFTRKDVVVLAVCAVLSGAIIATAVILIVGMFRKTKK